MQHDLPYDELIKRCSLDDLLDIKSHIDEEKYPERYALVLSEIEKRKAGIPSSGQVTSEIVNKKRSIYAGFGKRFGARLIDLIVVYAFVILYMWLSSYSKIVSLILVVPMFFLYSCYNIYFHAKWGKTIGKWVMEIIVVKLNGDPISFREAFLRSSVDVVLAVFSALSLVIGLLNFPELEYLSIGWVERAQRIAEFAPVWFYWVKLAENIWVWSEVVVLLFNRKKRAIHDFIAGTVVIHEDQKMELIDSMIVEQKEQRK